MFSKKMLWWTLIGIIFSLTFEKLLTVPPSRYRPLLILGGLLLIVARYLRDKGYFTEEKLVEKVAEHRKEPTFHKKENQESPKHTSSSQKPLF